MSLRAAPLLYVFFETTRLERHRGFLERTLGLPVIEIEPHLPHHRHGVVKYDGGDLILSLNLSSAGEFTDDSSDALVTVFDVGSPWLVSQCAASNFVTFHSSNLFTDTEGHHYRVRSRRRTVDNGLPPARVAELRLGVRQLGPSVRFYANVLDLELLEQTDTAARFATGSVDLVLEASEAAADGRAPRHHTYLIVFHTASVRDTHMQLTDRGVSFKKPRPGFSDIGGSSRFEDPDGHRLCIYEPSAESLTWGSGPKVIDIAGRRGACALERAN